jgi:acyl-lipid omega-6 desaturase (Delta-12 desaturase)
LNQSPNPKAEAPAADVPLTPSVWKKLIAEYQKPSLPKAIWQIVNTMVPYIATWALLYWSTQNSYHWWTAGFIFLLGMLTVRTFIIFHDCCHGSFFQSSRACQVVGYITGMLAFTPFGQWRWEHNIHHASSGHLDKRGTGDVWMMTLREYLEASRWKRLAYRLTRNPFILFCVGPLYLFLIWQRIPNTDGSPKERRSVHWMNLGIFSMAAILGYFYGYGTYLLIVTGTMFVAGGAGVWMFYVQHQYEGVYWERADEWDYTTAALQGSSFYKLPRILQWFTGNIGFHHIHHLSPRIANYNLERCHNEIEIFQKVKPITFLTSLKSLGYRFWDEDRQIMVGYKGLREFIRQQSQQNQAA